VTLFATLSLTEHTVFAGTIIVKGKTVSAVQVAYYYDANGTVLQVEDVSQVKNRKIKASSKAPPALPQQQDLGPAPANPKEALNPHAVVAVYVGVKRSTKHVVVLGVEDVSNVKHRMLKLADPTPIQPCAPPKVCVPCFGGCCCR
jgi:hypothetical protein